MGLQTPPQPTPADRAPASQVSPASAPCANADALAVGSTVDRYRVIKALGEGAMGAVYQVEHVHMKKLFALKVLHASTMSHPEIVARFEREAHAAGQIDHPNVAAATDFGKLPNGSYFLVLEFAEGRLGTHRADDFAHAGARGRRVGREAQVVLEHALAIDVAADDPGPEFGALEHGRLLPQAREEGIGIGQVGGRERAVDRHVGSILPAIGPR